jgi:hypothetical protein
MLVAMIGVSTIEFDQCAWLKRTSGWNPLSGDQRLRGTALMVTNNPRLSALAKKCCDVPGHDHSNRIDQDARSELELSVQSADFGRTFATLCRSLWLSGNRAPLHGELEMYPFDAFLSLSWPPVGGVVARGVRQGPSSHGGSASSREPTAADPPIFGPVLPKGDYWMETDTHWVCIHQIPRTAFFYPADLPGGPDLSSLGQPRTTMIKFTNGNRDERKHAWDDKHWGKAKTKLKWTGRSLFPKASAPLGDGIPEVSGRPVFPHSVEELSVTLSTLRDQLIRAQRLDPQIREIIGALSREPKGTFLAQPRSIEGARAVSRSMYYRLASDGLVLAKVSSADEDLPLIPDIPYKDDKATKPPPNAMTWKHLILASAHNVTDGHHRSPSDMYDFLLKVVCWFPPESLKKDCQTWRDRCALCTSVHNRPRHEAPFHAVRSMKPYLRMQIDLMEVKPSGSEGERYILTTICVATRYPFLRTAITRDAPYLALLLLDIFLDAGVIPMVVQSDNEFVNLAFEEMCSLLGNNQLFSTALRPQSQGIVERSHLDIRKALTMIVSTFIRATPRKWPQYLRLLEAKLRHRQLAGGITPFQAVHGFAGSTTLQMSLGALQQIPVEVVHADWLRCIVSESKELCSKLQDHWESEAAQRARRHAEAKPEPKFVEGDLVLVYKPPFERGTGAILPQCDGPFRICRLPTLHTAVLEDVTTQDLFMKGRPVSVSRLIAFKYPSQYAVRDPTEIPSGSAALQGLKVGGYIAVEPRSSQFKRIHVARVDRIFVDQLMAEVSLMEIPRDQRFGPWERRPWHIWMTATGEPRKEVVSPEEILCQVELVNSALTPSSLEALAVLGIASGVMPGRDKSLPAVTAS